MEGMRCRVRLHIWSGNRRRERKRVNVLFVMHILLTSCMSSYGECFGCDWFGWMIVELDGMKCLFGFSVWPSAHLKDCFAHNPISSNCLSRQLLTLF